VGGRGVHLLDEGRVEGRDPLAVFGPHAVRRLRRLDGFVHCGDLVIVSRLDPATEEVAAFEELIGSHGGLGGPQTAAFVLVPSAWPVPDEPLFGAEALNALFRACLAFERQAAGDAAGDPGGDPAASSEAIPA
jgi:hypothetical protein